MKQFFISANLFESNFNLQSLLENFTHKNEFFVLEFDIQQSLFNFATATCKLTQNHIASFKNNYTVLTHENNLIFYGVYVKHKYENGVYIVKLKSIPNDINLQLKNLEKRFAIHDVLTKGQYSIEEFVHCSALNSVVNHIFDIQNTVPKFKFKINDCDTIFVKNKEVDTANTPNFQVNLYWKKDFIYEKELLSHLSQNGKIMTYTSDLKIPSRIANCKIINEIQAQHACWKRIKNNMYKLFYLKGNCTLRWHNSYTQKEKWYINIEPFTNENKKTKTIKLKIDITSIKHNLWNSGVNYKENDRVLCEINGKYTLYYCTQSHTSDNDFDDTKWSKISDGHLPKTQNNSLLSSTLGKYIFFQLSVVLYQHLLHYPFKCIVIRLPWSWSKCDLFDKVLYNGEKYLIYSYRKFINANLAYTELVLAQYEKSDEMKKHSYLEKDVYCSDDYFDVELEQNNFFYYSQNLIQHELNNESIRLLTHLKNDASTQENQILKSQQVQPTSIQLQWLSIPKMNQNEYQIYLYRKEQT